MSSAESAEAKGKNQTKEKAGGVVNTGTPITQRAGPLPVMAQTGCWRPGRACPLCPGISDINLFRYCQSIVYFDPEISDGAFDLGVAKQKLDGPEIAGATVDQGSLRASERMRPEKPRV